LGEDHVLAGTPRDLGKTANGLEVLFGNGNVACWEVIGLSVGTTRRHVGELQHVVRHSNGVEGLSVQNRAAYQASSEVKADGGSGQPTWLRLAIRIGESQEPPLGGLDS
jgi:hypothetical protein